MHSLATNRQKKLLNLFGVEFSDKLTVGAAGWEIGRLLSDPTNRHIWNAYLYLTGDYSSETEELLPFSEAELSEVKIPEEWSARAEVNAFQTEWVEFILADSSPYDNPEPQIQFENMAFCFTGGFEYGERTDCVEAIKKRGGKFIASLTTKVDYLVIGQHGSSEWIRSSFGRKIEKAVLRRRERGAPAIVSEAHWVKCLEVNP